jgi:hypothetical protein
MSDHIGAGYGSEFHLMRYLGRYRNLLNALIEKEIGGRVIEWLDFSPGTDIEYDIKIPEKIKLPDHEIIGLEFLKEEDSDAFGQWKNFWPQSGIQPNWDGICRTEINSRKHWLLVEAKGNIDEIKSDCGAQRQSLTTIKTALSEMQKAFDLNSSYDLTKEYYQYANRLGVLYFLIKHNVPAKILFIYFIGDKNPKKEARCPKSIEEWKKPLEEQSRWIGLEAARKKSLGVHELYLNVVPPRS